MSDAGTLRVALTFDAEHPDRPLCPPGNAERILDALGEAGIRATFFIQSRWATSNPGTAKRIAYEGHVIGNHSKYHARMPLFSDDGLRTDVREAEEEIRRISGVDPKPWFRCPFGAGHDDQRVLGTLRDLGYRNVYWNVMAEDWEEWQTPDGVASSVVEGAKATDGAVVLLHTWPAPTSEALPRILEQLKGSRFATVDELESLP